MELSKSVIKKLERMAINKFCLVHWSLEQPLAKFPKFSRKTLAWTSFLTKIAGCLTVPENFHLGNLRNLQGCFYENDTRMVPSAISCYRKCFDKNILFERNTKNIISSDS